MNKVTNKQKGTRKRKEAKKPFLFNYGLCNGIRVKDLFFGIKS